MAKRGFQGAVARGFGARDHEATVTSTELLAPGCLRIWFRSDTLFDEIEAGPTAWLRFWLPDPDDEHVEHQRAYTISDADEDAGAFAVDFVLHDTGGPGAAWAANARPGTTVALMSFGSTKFELPQEPPAGYLLIGDSVSIPALSAIVRIVPAETPIEVYLEEHRAEDRLIPFPDHPRMRLHWVPRRGAESLAQAIEVRDWSDWYAWAIPESASLKHVRARLRDEFGFPKTELHHQAYWVHGRAMGKLRSGKKSAEESAAEAAAIEPPITEPGAPPSPVASPARASGRESEPAAHRGAWRSQAGSRLVAPMRRTFFIAGAIQGIVTLIQLAPFFLLVELARRLLDDAPNDQLWEVGLWAVGLLFVGALLALGLLLWLHAMDARFERDVRQRLLCKLARLPLGWFETRSSGQVKQLVQDDTLALHYLVTHAVPDAVAAVVAPVAVLVYLFVVDWRLALLLFIPILVYLVMATTMVVQSGSKISQALRWRERMSSEAGGYLEGQPVIRVFGGAAASTFRLRLAEYIAFVSAWQRPFIRQKTIMDLTTRPTTFLLLIVLFGSMLITTDRMKPVELLPFLLLGTTFGPRLLGIGYGLSGLRTGFLAARRIQVTLDEQELVTAPATTPVDPGVATGLVEFDDVTFSYQPGVPVLQDVSLKLEPGTVTALVGPSGSGKSTLAALLARFHDVDSGRVCIGGRDIREFSADELYARVGFVFQQTQLVLGTVRENIALAVPGASRADVERVARAAQIHDRISRLPEGYETFLGPDAALSGGERQRLTIARAILADTPVLVLDEATAFADPESEYLVQRALNRLTAGRTVLVIAHRLHTITGVDQIVVLDHGRIVEIGTHEALLANDGRYRQLWNADGATQPLLETEKVG